MENDRFRIEGEINRGGMGVVWKAMDGDVLRHVAVKAMHPSDDEELLARFVEEARIMGQLDHPNIVPVHDILRDERGRPTRFIMALVDGRTLAEILDEEREAPVSGERLEELLRVFLKVADAIAFAHSRGVVHQDVTPRNVMVASHGRVYVMDWGLAVVRGRERGVTTRRAPDRFDVSGALGGTPAYMAPEQARGQRRAVDPRTDVFGLGGILYHLLTLRPPWVAATPGEVVERAKAGVVTPPRELV